MDRVGGEWCWNKQEEKREGAPRAPGEQPFPRPWLEQDQGGGLEEEGLSGKAEGQDYAQAGPWLCPLAC